MIIIMLLRAGVVPSQNLLVLGQPSWVRSTRGFATLPNMQRGVEAVLVRTDKEYVWVEQPDDGDEHQSATYGGNLRLSPDQIPLLIEHLQEARREFESASAPPLD